MNSLAQQILGQRQWEELFRHPPSPAREALIEGQKKASRPVIVRGVAGMTSVNSLAPHIELYGAVAERALQRDLPAFQTPGLPGIFRMIVEPHPSQWFVTAEGVVLRVAKPLPPFTEISDVIDPPIKTTKLEGIIRGFIYTLICGTLYFTIAFLIFAFLAWIKLGQQEPFWSLVIRILSM